MKKHVNVKRRIGIIVALIAVIFASRYFYRLGHQWSILLITTAVVAIALLVIFTFVEWIQQRNYRKFQESMPYMFDFIEEYKQYNRVGSKKGKYKNYTMWNEHISAMYNSISSEKDKMNFQRYINKIKRSYEDSYDATTSIMIPLIITVLSVLITYDEIKNLQLEYRAVVIIITAFVAVLLMMKQLMDDKNYIAFYSDCLEIISNTNTPS